MDMSAEYKKAIEKGSKLRVQQKEMVWSTDGPARDMQASYTVNTGKVKKSHVDKIAPLLASENIPAKVPIWVDIKSRRKKAESMSLTRVHAKSGALIVVEVDKFKDEIITVCRDWMHTA